MTTASFSTFLDTTASTKGPPAFVGNKRGGTETKLVSVTIVNPMPISPELKQIYKIDAARTAWVSYAPAGTNIDKGDEITVAGVFTDAHVIAAAQWPDNNAFLELIISETL